MEAGELQQRYSDAVQLLKKLISTPSFSREEQDTAEIINDFFKANNIPTHRQANNVWAFNKHFDPSKPSILLNSHHDTVKPNTGYTNNPFEPIEKEVKLFGLGSNDAGGCLVSLIAVFLHFYEQTDLKYNLVMAATAEEEISGKNGIELVFPEFGDIDFAIVGEPTLMDLAVSERGLMVVDAVAHGKSGHAARDEGENAIYKALKDIEWIRTFEFPKVSPTLGKVKASVTVVHAGTQHNVVPDKCEFVVDIRISDSYTHEEILGIMAQNMSSDITPRSTRLRSSFIPLEHPFVQSGLALGRKTYGSPTTSDQALIPVTSVKIGPGDSARSHTADEFIYLDEIKEGIDLYAKILEGVLK